MVLVDRSMPFRSGLNMARSTRSVFASARWPIRPISTPFRSESLGFLEGLDLWIVDALRYTPHPSHFSLPETLDWIAKLRPKRAILTNLHSDLDFARLKSELPANVEPAFDGMRVRA